MSLKFTKEEAGALLSMLIAYGDQKSSLEEWEAIYDYYDHETGALLVGKFEKEGLNIWDVAKAEVEKEIMPALKKADRDFQVRALAVGLKVARADGNVSEEELDTLNNYCDKLAINIDEVEEYCQTIG